jgi:hypothetical protein
MPDPTYTKLVCLHRWQDPATVQAAWTVGDPSPWQCTNWWAYHGGDIAWVDETLYSLRIEENGGRTLLEHDWRTGRIVREWAYPTLAPQDAYTFGGYDTFFVANSTAVLYRRSPISSALVGAQSGHLAFAMKRVYRPDGSLISLDGGDWEIVDPRTGVHLTVKNPEYHVLLTDRPNTFSFGGGGYYFDGRGDWRTWAQISDPVTLFGTPLVRIMPGGFFPNFADPFFAWLGLSCRATRATKLGEGWLIPVNVRNEVFIDHRPVFHNTREIFYGPLGNILSYRRYVGPETEWNEHLIPRIPDAENYTRNDYVEFHVREPRESTGTRFASQIERYLRGHQTTDIESLLRDVGGSTYPFVPEYFTLDRVTVPWYPWAPDTTVVLQREEDITPYSAAVTPDRAYALIAKAHGQTTWEGYARAGKIFCVAPMSTGIAGWDDPEAHPHTAPGYTYALPSSHRGGNNLTWGPLRPRTQWFFSTATCKANVPPRPPADDELPQISAPIDVAGFHHLAYAQAEVIYHRKCPVGGAWGPVHQIAAGDHPWLTITDTGVLHLAYFDPNGATRHAESRDTGDTWSPA